MEVLYPALSKLNCHRKGLLYMCLHQCFSLDQGCALKWIFWSSPPIIHWFISWNSFGAHELSCFYRKLSCKGCSSSDGHLGHKTRLGLRWSERPLWNGSVRSSAPNVLLYRSSPTNPHQLVMQMQPAILAEAPVKQKQKLCSWISINECSIYTTRLELIQNKLPKRLYCEHHLRSTKYFTLNICSCCAILQAKLYKLTSTPVHLFQEEKILKCILKESGH